MATKTEGNPRDRVRIKREGREYKEGESGPVVSRRAFDTVWSRKGYVLAETVTEAGAGEEATATTATPSGGSGSGGGGSKGGSGGSGS